MSGKRACYHCLQSNGPNNDFKFDEQLLEYCTWTDSDNNFYYLCRWIHSRYHTGVQRRYQYGYLVHIIEDARLTWHEATSLYGYTRPERYFGPSNDTHSCPSLRDTLEDVLAEQQLETAQLCDPGNSMFDDEPTIFLE